jgi:hypothetical protein
MLAIYGVWLLFSPFNSNLVSVTTQIKLFLTAAVLACWQCTPGIFQQNITWSGKAKSN